MSKKDKKLKNLETADGKQSQGVNEPNDKLQGLEYADGKKRDDIDLIEEQERIFGVDKLSPYRTASVKVFRKRLETMSRDEMTMIAERNAVRVLAAPEEQHEALMRGFLEWLSVNGSPKDAEEALAYPKKSVSEKFMNSQNHTELEDKLKKMSLADLQSAASRLGFNASFDRDRLISVILSEYHRQ